MTEAPPSDLRQTSRRTPDRSSTPREAQVARQLPAAPALQHGLEELLVGTQEATPTSRHEVGGPVRATVNHGVHPLLLCSVRKVTVAAPGIWQCSDLLVPASVSQVEAGLWWQPPGTSA